MSKAVYLESRYLGCILYNIVVDFYGGSFEPVLSRLVRISRILGSCDFATNVIDGLSAPEEEGGS